MGVKGGQINMWFEWRYPELGGQEIEDADEGEILFDHTESE